MNKRIIFECITGSHLYGMATPESDVDMRGVCLEGEIDIYGLGNFEQFEQKFPDRVIYGLQKFARLAAGSNPNIVELLFVNDNIVTDEKSASIWKQIQYNRFKFISKKVTQTFVGYVKSQRKRMDTHHRWMTDRAPVRPHPEAFGLMTINGVSEWTNNNLKQAYENKLKEYQDYTKWLENRNDKRHELEKRFGFDTKHGSHIVRLLEQVDELHTYGTITFPRPEAHLLKAIRTGGWSYDFLINHMEKKIQYIDSISHPASVLPETEDTNAINELLIDIYRRNL